MIRRAAISREAIVGLTLVGVYLAYTAVFWAYPFFWLAKLSVTQWRFFDDPVFVGARNLVRIVQDPQFLGSLWNVVRFLAFYLPLAFGGSLLVAFGLQQVGRGRAFVALCFLLSNVSSGVALSLVFLKIFSTTGPLNNTLYDAVGIRIPWTNHPTLAMLAIALVVAWKFVGYYGLIVYSGLLTVPKELYDAARLDHAGVWRRLVNITLPMLNPQLMMVLTFAILVSFGLFTEPFLITGGGPADSTVPPQMVIYETAFRRLQPSHAATMSIIISLASYLLVVLARRLFERKVVIA
ncbi:carbohydrate ABC transporter membrane protein 1, CUT1 family [Sphingomonas guangdongensis]|uniref:Carbohydrate ABC transporter membrane protein 1, CUT1 family n=1 Tax=Sphingomonas guangdongensis TaxID=1141890 RepID=A0A285R1U9_9SPHN|nr:sugar ABC transporter permease [Sphingomonas guangdongensis]SOB87689.1 carbohydrate ABC transporter membrane protein 1, CUT1 family [Sphingomonas guangdongensis]